MWFAGRGSVGGRKGLNDDGCVSHSSRQELIKPFEQGCFGGGEGGWALGALGDDSADFRFVSVDSNQHFFSRAVSEFLRTSKMRFVCPFIFAMLWYRSDRPYRPDFCHCCCDSNRFFSSLDAPLRLPQLRCV